MAKRNRHKRNRAKARSTRKVQVQTAVACAPAVHICGQRTSVDPRNPEGLSRYQRELIREAASIQACRAQGEVMSSHMIVQEPFGWSVHSFNPALPERQFLDGKIEDIVERTTSPRYSRRMRMVRAAEQEDAAARHARLRELSARREAVQEAMRDETF